MSTDPLWEDPADVSVLNIPSINALEEVSVELSPFVFQIKKLFIYVEQYPAAFMSLPSLTKSFTKFALSSGLGSCFSRYPS